MPRLAVNAGEMQIVETIFCSENCTVASLLASDVNFGLRLPLQPDLGMFSTENGPDIVVHPETMS